MKRLTYTDEEMEEMPGMDCPVKQDDGSLVQDFCERVCEEFQHNCPFEEMGKKLKAYEDAEEQGLLRILPCKVGDTVWCIEEYEDGFEKTGYMFLAMCGDYYIVSPHLVGVSDINDQLAEMEEDCRNWGSVYLKIFPKNRVFLTKAEAEKALAEMG